MDNLDVHDNTIVQTSGQWAAGVAQDIGDKSVFGRRLRFDRNHYILSTDGEFFGWMNDQRRAEGWKEYGHDHAGTFDW